MLSCLWLAEYFIAVCLISDLRWFAVMPGYVQHFTHAGNDKMKCRYCQEDIKFTNSHLHSSNLRNHLTFKHPEKLSVPEKAKVPKIDDYFTGHKSSLPSLLDRQTLAVCCPAHPLPFNLVEDKVFQWAYNCPVKDRRRISIRVTELARDWREKICGSFPGKFFTILLDGWTNPVTNVVQKDTSCVIDFATAFAKIRNSWEKNMTLSRETRNDLEKQWSKRLQMFTCSIIGYVCNYFKNFLFDNETSSIFTSPADILAVQTWALQVLPSTNLEVFKAEATEIEDVKNLGQPVVPANFRIHKTLANLILKVVVSEACVKRAFSRHKLFHSNLRANLKAEKLDEQLFSRYNFQKMIDTASTVNQSHGESDDDDDFLPFEWLCSKFVGCLKFKLTV